MAVSFNQIVVGQRYRFITRYEDLSGTVFDKAYARQADKDSYRGPARNLVGFLEILLDGSHREVDIDVDEMTQIYPLRAVGGRRHRKSRRTHRK